MGVLTPTVFSYMTDKAQSGTGVEHNLAQMDAEVVLSVASLSAFLRGARYGPIERLTYYRMVYRCESGGSLLRVPFCLIKSWYALGIYCLF